MIEKLFKMVTLGKRHGPMQLVLFVTAKCNCRCAHCFYWKELNKDYQLSLNEYEKISQNTGRLRTLCITGGEPFLRKDIVEIVKIFSHNTNVKHIQIPTNGILTEFIIDSAKTILSNKNIKLNISVSIDGLEEKHNKIRRNKNCFQHAVNTIKALQLLSSLNANFTVLVCTHVSNLTIGDIEEFSEFVKEKLNPDMHMFELVRGNLESEAIKNISEDKVDLLYEFIETYTKSYNDDLFFLKREPFSGKFTKYLLKKQYNNCKEIFFHKKNNYKCYTPYLSNVIYPDGSVSFCEGQDLNLNIKDFDYNLTNLTGSAIYKKNALKSKGCSCTNGLYQGYNTLLNPF